LSALQNDNIIIDVKKMAVALVVAEGSGLHDAKLHDVS
jgi:hypothetical protein